MQSHETTDWHTLLIRADTPSWVPGAVAELFLRAHGEGRAALVGPRSVYVDAYAQRLMQREDRKEELAPPDDLIACFSELFAIAVSNPHAMRHIFQQVALLWRAYREGRALPHGSQLEADIVSRLIHILGERFPAPWTQRMVRRQEKAPLTTLHQLVDVLYEALR